MSSADRRSKPVRHASLIPALLLGIAITLWNLFTAAHYMGIGRFHDRHERPDPLFTTLGLYESVAKKVVRHIVPAYDDVEVPSHESDSELNKGSNRRGGHAHLGHDYFLISPTGTKNLTRWNLDSRLRSYVAGSVMYDGGCLVAEESGYYYIYSQVSFVKALRDWTVNQSAVTHDVIRLSKAAREAQTLLRMQKTHRWDKQLRCTLDASYLGGTFFLHKGDMIVVAVSDANFIWQSPRRTYFGMRSL